MPNEHNPYNDKTILQMLREVGHLLLVLLARLLIALLKLLMRFGKILLKLVCKFLLLVIDLTQRGITRAQAFWHDNDTQEKLRKAKEGCRRAAITTVWALGVAARATGRGLCWLGRKLRVGAIILFHATIYALLHIGPTLRAAGRAIGRAACATGRRLRLMGRGLKKWYRRRQRAWRHFRRNKGFKGLLIDLGTWLKAQISNYVDEQPDDSALDEPADDLEAESRRLLEQTDEEEALHNASPEVQQNGTRIHTFGRGIYNALKRIVEDD